MSGTKPVPQPQRLAHVVAAASFAALFWARPSLVMGILAVLAIASGYGRWPARWAAAARLAAFALAGGAAALGAQSSLTPLWLGAVAVMLVALSDFAGFAWEPLIPAAGGVVGAFATQSAAIGLGATLVLAAAVTAGILHFQQNAAHHVQQRRADELDEEVRRLTTTDRLTGLANRSVMDWMLAQAITEGQSFALVVLDISRFAHLNSVYGPALGDEVIRQFAQRLESLLEEGDQAFRTTADTFVVTVKAPKSKVGLAQIVARWQTELTRPYYLDSVIDLAVSAGVVMHPEHGHDLDTLLGHAGTALLRAKKAGPNAYRFYYHLPQSPTVQGPELRWALREAIAKGDLGVYYQPQVALDSGSLCGVEALARWQHPDWGFVSPSVFVPAAEEAGLISEIGDWVLETACLDILSLGLPEDVTLSVNFSAAQFVRPDVADRVQETLERVGFDPRRLVLEVTESLTIDSVPRVIDKLNALRSLGIRISVDDFGTRYASLSYLKTFPVDELKIDKSFVADIVKYPAIPSAIVTLARHMNIQVVAEGIETPEQAEYLQLLGCQVMQGYLYAKPMPKEQLAMWAQQPTPQP